MNKMLLALLVLTLITSVATAENKAEFFVSQNSSNKTAFRTIEEARKEIRKFRSDFDGDIVVNIDGGVYREGPMQFHSSEMGRNGHFVIFKAMNVKNPPVISGGRLITGWQPGRNGRWTAKTDSALFRQIYVNGVRAIRARGPFPDQYSRYGDLEYIDGDCGYTLPGHLEMAEWINQDRIELHYFNSWSHMICGVSSIAHDGDSVKIRMQQPEFMLASRKEGVQATVPAIIENAYELLDEPGEWYLNWKTNVIEYIPRPGEDMTTAEFIAPGENPLISIIGPDTKSWGGGVENIRFEGITFADVSSYQPNMTGHVDVQANFTLDPGVALFKRDGYLTAIDNEYSKSIAGVILRNTRGIQFINCVFTRFGSAGIDLEAGCQNNTIAGCHFYDISGSAIQIGDVKRESHHPYVPEYMSVKGNKIIDNEIHDIGVEFQGSVGIFGGYICDTLIKGNHIYNCPYTGISIGWGWGEQDAGGGAYEVPYKYSTPTPCARNIIEYNHIHDVMQKRQDGGGIYMLGNQPGTVIRYNHIHDNRKDGWPGGIYLDEGSGFIEVTGNVVYNVNKAMNFNNTNQDRIKTCNVHDNYFDVKPGEKGFPEEMVKKSL